jgi:glycosyltransferase involved in cell wall biosynthesis
MDAYFLGELNSSMGIFQKNMIMQFGKNRSIDELHILSLTRTNDYPKCDNCHYHISRDSFIMRGRYMAKIYETVEPDAVFYTFNLIPLTGYVFRARKVLQNHDWSHAQFASKFDEKIKGHIYQMLHRRSSLKADLNLANSEFTGEETKKYAGRSCSVIYHDADPIYKGKDSIEMDTRVLYGLLPFNYIIYAGRVRPIYKNIRTLLLAFKNLSSKYKDLRLVLVHSDSFNKEDIDLVKRLNSSVLSLRNVSKLDLKYLYKNSLCMVYPSLYEGFGSPILEAQNSGTPVIAYNHKPMTEVGGDGAEYYDGTVTDLIQKVILFIEDSSARKNTINRGFINAKRFDWKITAWKTVEAFNEQ